jgi:hypothetical protein
MEVSQVKEGYEDARDGQISIREPCSMTIGSILVDFGHLSKPVPEKGHRGKPITVLRTALQRQRPEKGGRRTVRSRAATGLLTLQLHCANRPMANAAQRSNDTDVVHRFNKTSYDI